jgi:hypothetical protein
VQHLAQDQHGALTRRQLLERGNEREPNRLAGNGDVGGVSAGRHDTVVRHGLDPRLARQWIAERGVRAACRPEVHRSRPPLRAVVHVEADVRRDAIEPRAKCRPALEAIHSAPRTNERLLHGVFRLERRSEHAVAVAGELDAELLETRPDVRRDGGGRRSADGDFGHPELPCLLATS